MEIKELQIIPIKNDDSAFNKLIATCTATFENGLVVKNIRIAEGKKGIYVRYPLSVTFSDKQSQKECNNRILATYVINHCCDVYDTPATERKVA